MIKFYLLLIITAFMSALSQILLNISAKKEYKSKLREYLNAYVISAYAILGITLILNVFIMRYVELKEAHAIAALTYVFAMILSRIMLKEKITAKKIIGNILIIVGIVVFVLYT